MIKDFNIHEWRQNQIMSEYDVDNVNQKSSFTENTVNEHDWMTDSNDESGMVLVQLKSIIANATKLMEMNKEGKQYDSWEQAKFTKAADYLQSVYNYQSTEQ